MAFAMAFGPNVQASLMMRFCILHPLSLSFLSEVARSRMTILVRLHDEAYGQREHRNVKLSYVMLLGPAGNNRTYNLVRLDSRAAEEHVLLHCVAAWCCYVVVLLLCSSIWAVMLLLCSKLCLVMPEVFAE